MKQYLFCTNGSKSAFFVPQVGKKSYAIWKRHFCITVRKVRTLRIEKFSQNGIFLMSWKMCGNYDILTHFQRSRTFKFTGILIPAYYPLHTFFDALSANSPYSVAKKNNIWYYYFIRVHTRKINFFVRRTPKVSTIGVILRAKSWFSRTSAVKF